MADTLTPLQSRFVQAYLANDGQQARAYLVASPKANQQTAEANASRLMQMAKIQQEIAHFRQLVAERGAVTQDKLLDEYWSSYHTARALLDITAARMCLDSIGKLTGFMDTTINHKVSGTVNHEHRDAVASLSVHELRALAAGEVSLTVGDSHEQPQAQASDTVDTPSNVVDFSP